MLLLCASFLLQFSWSNYTNEEIICIAYIRQTTEIIIHWVMTRKFSVLLMQSLLFFNSFGAFEQVQKLIISGQDLTNLTPVEAGDEFFHIFIQLMHVNITKKRAQDTTLGCPKQTVHFNDTHLDVSCLQSRMDKGWGFIAPNLLLKNVNLLTMRYSVKTLGDISFNELNNFFEFLINIFQSCVATFPWWETMGVFQEGTVT